MYTWYIQVKKTKTALHAAKSQHGRPQNFIDTFIVCLLVKNKVLIPTTGLCFDGCRSKVLPKAKQMESNQIEIIWNLRGCFLGDIFRRTLNPKPNRKKMILMQRCFSVMDVWLWVEVSLIEREQEDTRFGLGRRSHRADLPLNYTIYHFWDCWITYVNVSCSLNKLWLLHRSMENQLEKVGKGDWNKTPELSPPGVFRSQIGQKLAKFLTSGLHRSLVSDSSSSSSLGRYSPATTAPAPALTAVQLLRRRL